MPGGRSGGAPGKLIAVARAWAGGRGGAQARADDAASDGAVLPDWMVKRAATDVIEIDEEDGNVVALFMSLDTQWRMHAMTGARLGLDYAAIKPAAELFGFALSPAVMGDLRVMEIAALNEFADQARRSARA